MKPGNLKHLKEAGRPRPLFVGLWAIWVSVDSSVICHVQFHRQIEHCGLSPTSYRGRFVILVSIWTSMPSQFCEGLRKQSRKKENIVAETNGLPYMALFDVNADL